MADNQRRGGSSAARGETRKARETRPQGEAMQDPTDGDGSARSAPGRGENGGRGSRGAGGTRSRSAAGTGSARGGAGGDEAALRKELRGFVSSHRQGWNHDQWSQLLSRLQEQGFDTSRSDEIGQQLERERLALHLEGVQGVGPARVKKLQEEFGSLWELRNAGAERIAEAGGVKRDVAERIRESLG